MTDQRVIQDRRARARGAGPLDDRRPAVHHPVRRHPEGIRAGRQEHEPGEGA